jgi:aspartate/methionine/tyrosine aminotransferase
VQAGVTYVPGRVHAAGDGYGRINYVTPDQDALAEGLARLARL